MATELQNTSKTDNLPAPETDVDGVGAPPAQLSLSRRLEAVVGGRALTCVRWLVVFGFISCGYFGAAAVNAGLSNAPPSQHQILAASGTQK